MKKLKNKKGITLVALVITIVVLLILAAILINSINNNGIIGKAKEARNNYTNSAEKEQEAIDELKTKIDNANNSSSGEVKVLLSSITSVVSQNKVVEDQYGNKVTIPTGFTVSSESGEDVTKGVVIEDANGNQFVWVPVGKIYTDVAKTEANAKTINLSRYTFDYQTGAPMQKIDAYYQELEAANESGTSIYGNKTAKSISGFKTSVDNNGGYYIGRYEAGTTTARTTANDELTTLVCKYNQSVYNYVTQAQASNLAQGMYTSNDFTSDLVNSYAWDTAIVYIQTFGTGTDANKYSRINRCTSFADTGINNDEYCKINDMSGNVYEWTTEACSGSENRPCVVHGGCYYTDFSTTFNFASDYMGCDISNSYSYDGFRPILYL